MRSATEGLLDAESPPFFVGPDRVSYFLSCLLKLRLFHDSAKILVLNAYQSSADGAEFREVQPFACQEWIQQFSGLNLFPFFEQDQS